MKVFDRDVQPDPQRSALPSVKIILALVLLVALITQNRLDPSPLNLLQPAEGIGNWFGLPGALIAGSLLDCFGLCGYLLPLSLLFLNHKESLNRKQVILLDSAFLLLLTIGMSQLSLEPNAQIYYLTGLLGTVSSIYLAEIPGKLMTLLIVTGFSFRYAKHYRLNLHFFVMLQNLGALGLVATAFLNQIAQKRLGVLGSKISQQISPFSTASKNRVSEFRNRSAKNWGVASSRILDWLLELSPFFRLPAETAGSSGTLHLSEEAIQEIKQRSVLSHTIEEFEKRSVVENE